MAVGLGNGAGFAAPNACAFGAVAGLGGTITFAPAGGAPGITIGGVITVVAAAFGPAGFVAPLKLGKLLGALVRAARAGSKFVAFAPAARLVRGGSAGNEGRGGGVVAG